MYILIWSTASFRLLGIISQEDRHYWSMWCICQPLGIMAVEKWSRRWGSFLLISFSSKCFINFCYQLETSYSTTIPYESLWNPHSKFLKNSINLSILKHYIQFLLSLSKKKNLRKAFSELFISINNWLLYSLVFKNKNQENTILVFIKSSSFMEYGQNIIISFI